MKIGKAINLNGLILLEKVSMIYSQKFTFENREKFENVN